MRDNGTLAQIITAGVFFGMMFGAYMIMRSCTGGGGYNPLYARAESQAIKQFGDKAFPLTLVEKQEWYQKMGLQTDTRPSRKDLATYLAGNPELSASTGKIN